MAKTITVDFWDVLDVNDQPVDLAPIITAAGQLSVTDRMKPRGPSHIDFLEQTGTHGPAVSGVLGRMRTEDWPPRVNIRSGQRSLLPLRANEAISEEMSFRFDAPLEVLATQRHQYFRATKLAELLMELSGQRFRLQPKLREDAWQRFNEMTNIGSVEFKIRGSTHNPQFSRTIPSMARLVNEASSEFEAMTIGVKLSVGHVKESLVREKVMAIVDYLRGDQSESLEDLTVRGSAADNKAHLVDFINDRLIFTGEVEYSNKHLDPTRCQQLLAQAIEMNRPYLTSLL